MTMTSVPKVLDCQSDSPAREEMTQPVTAENKYNQPFYERQPASTMNPANKDQVTYLLKTGNLTRSLIGPSQHQNCVLLSSKHNKGKIRCQNVVSLTSWPRCCRR